MLDAGLHFVVEEVEPLQGTSLLGREVKVVVTVMLVLSLGLFTELVYMLYLLADVTDHIFYVLYNAWS